MFSSITQQIRDRLWPRDRDTKYETLRTVKTDKDEFSDEVESGAPDDVNRVSTATLARLRRLRLMNTLTTVLLIFVSLMWVGREYKTQRVYIAPEIYSTLCFLWRLRRLTEPSL